MNDQSDTTRNPYHEAPAQASNNESVKREDCWFDHEEEDVLYDAYLILRDAGYTEEELAPLAALIDRTTIYDGGDPEWLYGEMADKE